MNNFIVLIWQQTAAFFFHVWTDNEYFPWYSRYCKRLRLLKAPFFPSEGSRFFLKHCIVPFCPLCDNSNKYGNPIVCVFISFLRMQCIEWIVLFIEIQSLLCYFSSKKQQQLYLLCFEFSFYSQSMNVCANGKIKTIRINLLIQTKEEKQKWRRIEKRIKFLQFCDIT